MAIYKQVSIISAFPAEEIDVIFALGSIGKNFDPLFEIEKNITQTILKQQMSPQTRQGVIVFGEEAKEKIPLQEIDDLPEMRAKIQKLEWPSNAKSLTMPFEKAAQMFKEQGETSCGFTVVIWHKHINTLFFSITGVYKDLSSTWNREY